MSTPSLSVTSETSSSQPSPQIDSCCFISISLHPGALPCAVPTATSIRSLPTSSMERITFFSIFTNCESFFARSGPNAPGWTDLRNVWPLGVLSAPVCHLLRSQSLTDVGLSKQPRSLGRGRRRRWVLDLRRCWSARLAHRVCAMHGCGVVRMKSLIPLWCVGEVVVGGKDSAAVVKRWYTV
jgi:hypothetical protein